MDLAALVDELAACDPAAADRHALEECAAMSARVRAWLDGFDVQVGRALEAKSGYGAKVLADAMKLSLAAGTRVIERGETLQQVPAVEGAVHAGDVSGAHVDVITRALRQVPKARRGDLASIIDERVCDARSLPANEYEDRLKGRGAPLARRRRRKTEEAVDPISVVGRQGVRDVAGVHGARSRDRGVGRQADHR